MLGCRISAICLAQEPAAAPEEHQDQEVVRDDTPDRPGTGEGQRKTISHRPIRRRDIAPLTCLKPIKTRKKLRLLTKSQPDTEGLVADTDTDKHWDG